MNRVHTLEEFAARLRERMVCFDGFDQLALGLFALQFDRNPAYRNLCKSRNIDHGTLHHWSEIPAIPAAAFKELELSCIPVSERTVVFFSSGTTDHRPSRHFHSEKSLQIYEASLLAWFGVHMSGNTPRRGLALTPPCARAPHSSLVHMFDTLRRRLGFTKFAFTAQAAADGAWLLDAHATVEFLRDALGASEPVLLLGTAFSYVHLLDHLAERKLTLRLPEGSQVLETGGYKGRSRTLPKSELHALITARLGVPGPHIVCEYGMSELSSQAYDQATPPDAKVRHNGSAGNGAGSVARPFRFPPWAKVQIISPESGREVEEGETGLIRVFDLANVYSVMAIQTEDLAVRRGTGFQLIGRAALAESRGCSLLAG